MSQHGNCPKCKASFDGERMMDSWRRLYPGKTEEYLLKWFSLYCSQDSKQEQLLELARTKCWGRQIGLETRSHDGTALWYCPDCGHVWKRFP